MRTFVRLLDTLCIYIGIGFVCLFFIPFFIIMACLPPLKRFNSKFFHYSSYWFFKAIVFVSRIKVVCNGFEHPPKKPVIFIANHQSSLDIPLVGSAISEFPLIWLARSELERSFLLRIVLWCCAITTEVESPRKSAISLRKLFTFLKNSSLCPIIFPEGSRYNDGLIHEFFNGFAFLAREANRPVVPILIEKAFRVYPRGAFLVNRTYVISVTQGPEFLISPGETIDDFGARVKAWFLENNNNAHL